MEVMEAGRFNVSPFELERILELNIEKRVNEHALLYLHGVIKEGGKDSVVSSITEDTKVKFKVDDAVVFSGILKSIHVTCTDAVYYLDAVVISNTVLLDVTPMQRSFQEAGQEYKSIGETVIKDAKAKLHFNAPAKQVENIILQYRETDWEFLKRIASHSNSVRHYFGLENSENRT